MLRAGVEGLRDGAERAGLAEPFALAVTVLTSDAGAPPHIFPHRVALAAEAGCGGIVCAAADLAEARQLAPRLLRVVPGIRRAGTDVHDQARAVHARAPPSTAAPTCWWSGRTVTEADDPAAAAAGSWPSSPPDPATVRSAGPATRPTRRRRSRWRSSAVSRRLRDDARQCGASRCPPSETSARGCGAARRSRGRDETRMPEAPAGTLADRRANQVELACRPCRFRQRSRPSNVRPHSRRRRRPGRPAPS